MSRERWMALFFALGATCFFIGPFPGYAQLVGASADADTFFIGSILFTAGGALQTWIAFPGRHRAPPGRRPGGPRRSSPPERCSSTSRPIRLCRHRLTNSNYDRLVWRPDAFGSICFLISGAIAYRASTRHGWLPARGRSGWWQPAVNLLGCIFFGISAIAGYVVPSTGSVINLAAANWNTALGAACFLTCALATLFTGSTFKSPKLPRLHRLEADLKHDVERII